MANCGGQFLPCPNTGVFLLMSWRDGMRHELGKRKVMVASLLVLPSFSTLFVFSFSSTSSTCSDVFFVIIVVLGMV